MHQPADISPETAHRWVTDGEAILIDVREADEVASARLPKAVHVPMSAFDPSCIPLDSGKKIIFVCARGLRSEQVRQYVLSQGILNDAYNLAGGLMAWSQAGLPLETGSLSSPA